MDKELQKWLRANLGPRCLTPLTSTDCRALNAAAAIVELYAYDIYNDEGALLAFRTVVLRMQPSTRSFAYHAIAKVMDWDDRARVWHLAKLPAVSAVRCKHEPASRTFAATELEAAQP